MIEKAFHTGSVIKTDADMIETSYLCRNNLLIAHELWKNVNNLGVQLFQEVSYLLEEISTTATSFCL